LRTELEVQDAVNRYMEKITKGRPMNLEEIDKAVPALAGWRKSLEASHKTLENFVGEAIRKAAGRKVSLNPTPDDRFLREQMGKWFLGVIGPRPEWKADAEAALGVGKVALQEDVSAEGGFLIPKPLADEILRLAAPVAAVRPISRVIPMTSKTLDIPDLANEPTVALVAEEGTIPDSLPANPFGQKTLTAKKVAAFSTMSLEVMEDNLIGLGDLLLQIFAEKIAQEEDKQALEGDGTGQNFTGLFSMAGVNSVAAGGALTNLDKFVDGWSLLPLAAQMDESLTWIFHPKVWRDVRKLKATTNEYLLSPQPWQGTPMTLHGIPVRLTDQVATNRGAGSDTTAYIGAFGRGMIIGDRRRLSLDVNPYSKFQAAQVDIRVLERVAITVAIPKAFTKLTGITVS
jgi:HK97 family phage major capsid protein